MRENENYNQNKEEEKKKATRESTEAYLDVKIIIATDRENETSSRCEEKVMSGINQSK